jgi:hypothetical protein
MTKVDNNLPGTLLEGAKSGPASLPSQFEPSQAPASPDQSLQNWLENPGAYFGQSGSNNPSSNPLTNSTPLPKTPLGDSLKPSARDSAKSRSDEKNDSVREEGEDDPENFSSLPEGRGELSLEENINTSSASTLRMFQNQSLRQGQQVQSFKGELFHEPPPMMSFGEAPPPKGERWAQSRPNTLTSGNPSLRSTFMAKATQRMSFQGPASGTGIFQKMAKWGGYGGFGSGGNLYDLLIGNKAKDDVYASRQTVRKAERELQVKMRILMLMILMGDVAGAVRYMAFEAERQNRLFNRFLNKQLGKLREGKSKILLALGRKMPPKAHDTTNNPQAAEADRLAQQKYTSWTSVTTQLLSEMQQGEREIGDLLTQGRQHIDRMWETYKSLKEAEARTDRTVSQSFRE